MQTVTSAKVSPGPERLLSEGGLLPPLGLSPGQYYVYLGEGRPQRANVNPQQEPGGSAALEEPLEMFGITRMESASPATPVPGPESSLLEGRPRLPVDLSTVRQFMAFRESRADANELRLWV